MSVDWFRMDVDFAENKKVCSVTVSARWFHLAALCYCARNLTDGHIDARGVKVVGAICEMAPRRMTQQLVSAKLWKHDVGDDGFWINDYLSYQPTRAEMQEASDKKRAAGKLGGLASGKARASADASKQMLEQTVEAQYKTELQPPKGLSPLTTVKPPRVSSYEGDDAHASKGDTLGRLVALASTDGDRAKVLRAAAGLSEAELVNALEAARGPAVRDRLGAGLARMKRHREGRAA